MKFLLAFSSVTAADQPSVTACLHCCFFFCQNNQQQNALVCYNSKVCSNMNFMSTQPQVFFLSSFLTPNKTSNDETPFSELCQNW